MCTNCGSIVVGSNKVQTESLPPVFLRESIRRGKLMIALTATMQHPKLLTLTLPKLQKDARKE